MNLLSRMGIFVLLCAVISPISAKTLTNPGFEQAYIPVVPTGDTASDSAKITGSSAPGWSDNTGWAKDVAVEYGSDTANPHSGAACQRITVAKGFAQFTQGVQFPAGSFRASVWVRAQPAQWVSLNIRQAGPPYAFYGATPVKAGPQWTQITVDAPVPAGDGGLYFNMTVPGTVWLDDAALAPIKTLTQRLAPPSGPILRTFFGLNINHMHDPPGYDWPVMDFGGFRTWDSGDIWPAIETARGVYDWTNLDKDVAQAQAHHTQFLLTLGGTPRWATSAPETARSYVGFTVVPDNIQDWKDFLKAVATRYKDRIGAYEVWNEPDLPIFYTGTPAQLAALESAAAEVIHQADPSALLLTPPVSGGGGAGQLRFLEEYFAAGGGKSADVLAYHGYVYPAEGEITSLARFRAQAGAAGLGGKSVWDTETGTDLSGVSESDTAAYVSRALILGWALGCDRTYLYAYDGSFTGLDAPTADPKKRDPVHLGSSGAAYRQTMGWLSGAKMLSCMSDASGVWVCALRLPGGAPAWIVWNPSGPRRFTPPAKWRISPPPGGTLAIGPQPVRVTR